MNTGEGVALGAIVGSSDRVTDWNHKNLGGNRMMKLAPPLAPERSALKGFEGRFSSVLLPLFAIIATVLAINLWV